MSHMYDTAIFAYLSYFDLLGIIRSSLCPSMIGQNYSCRTKDFFTAKNYCHRIVTTIVLEFFLQEYYLGRYGGTPGSLVAITLIPFSAALFKKNRLTVKRGDLK
jgi:hypothetical protein